jgi:hypothetical protein
MSVSICRSINCTSAGEESHGCGKGSFEEELVASKSFRWCGRRGRADEEVKDK